MINVDRIDSAIKTEDFKFFDITNRKLQKYDIIAYSHNSMMNLVIVTEFISDYNIRGMYLLKDNKRYNADIYNTLRFFLSGQYFMIVTEQILQNDEYKAKYNKLISEYENLKNNISKKPVKRFFFLIKYLNNEEIKENLNCNWEDIVTRNSYVKYGLNAKLHEFSYNFSIQSVKDEFEKIKSQYPNYFVYTTKGFKKVKDISNGNILKPMSAKSLLDFFWTTNKSGESELFYIKNEFFIKVKKYGLNSSTPIFDMINVNARSKYNKIMTKLLEAIQIPLEFDNKEI